MIKFVKMTRAATISATALTHLHKKRRTVSASEQARSYKPQLSYRRRRRRRRALKHTAQTQSCDSTCTSDERTHATLSHTSILCVAPQTVVSPHVCDCATTHISLSLSLYSLLLLCVAHAAAHPGTNHEIASVGRSPVLWMASTLLFAFSSEFSKLEAARALAKAQSDRRNVGI